MKTIRVLLAAALLASVAFAQSSLQNYHFNVQDFNSWSATSQAAVVAGAGVTMTISPCAFPVANSGGFAFVPLGTNVKVTITDPATANETVTPTAVVNGATPFNLGKNTSVAVASTCTFTATFAQNHAAGVKVSSGDFGLYEAINFTSTNGGIVQLTPGWGGASPGTSGQINGGGFANVSLEEETTLSPTWYGYDGTKFQPVDKPAISANGASFVPFYNEELLTLATGSTTTDTVGNLLPANSIILAVGGIVKTTITAACTGWSLGDPTTASRFTANDTTLTANEAKTNSGAFLNTAIASATTGMYQSAAAKVRVTCAGGNPGAGAVRIFVTGYTWTNLTN